MTTKYKIWIEVEKIDNYGTDDETYSDCDFPLAVAYRDTYEEASKLQELIVDTFNELP